MAERTMGHRLDIVEDKLEGLYDKMSEITTSQAVILNNVGTMTKTLEVLADLRAESLHIMKVQETNKVEHDEVFTRVRALEAGRAECAEKHRVREKESAQNIDKFKSVKATFIAQEKRFNKALESYDEKLEDKASADDVKDLQSNQRWAITIVLSAIILAALKHIFWPG